MIPSAGGSTASARSTIFKILSLISSIPCTWAAPHDSFRRGPFHRGVLVANRIAVKLRSIHVPALDGVPADRELWRFFHCSQAEHIPNETDDPRGKHGIADWRIQPSFSIKSVCMNSCCGRTTSRVTAAQAWISPTGSKLNKTIKPSPTLIDQKKNSEPRPLRARSHSAPAGRTASARCPACRRPRTARRGRARGRVQALHVVEGDRRVDHEAEQAGAHHVPEGHGDEEVDRPAVCAPMVWRAESRKFSQASKPIRPAAPLPAR